MTKPTDSNPPSPPLKATRPALPGFPAPDQPSGTPLAEGSPNLMGLAGVRVLVVDDNTDQVMMLVGSLRLSGFSVRSTHTGAEALDIALQWRPDIVLLDIGMPIMDGYEVARRLRAAEAAERSKCEKPPTGMRLIALTGRSADTDKALGRNVGFDAYLTKPCDLDYLAMMMAALTPTKPPQERP